MATYKSEAATIRDGAFSSIRPGWTTITASYLIEALEAVDIDSDTEDIQPTGACVY